MGVRDLPPTNFQVYWAWYQSSFKLGSVKVLEAVLAGIM